MFTGLIQEKGSLLSSNKRDGGFEIEISRPQAFGDLKNGESISVDGACLTLVWFDENSMKFFVGAETILKTNLKEMKSHRALNLERSLALGDRLGGHMVTGHVDGVAKITQTKTVGECLFIQFQIDRELTRWIIPKGSVCLNGVSLTINNIVPNENLFEILLIPETLARTNLGGLQVGDFLNVECDQIVKIITHEMKGRHEYDSRTY